MMMKTTESNNLSKNNLPPEVKLSVEAGLDKKGEDIVVINIGDISSFADYFVIMNGHSHRQNKAISENIREKLKKRNIRPLSVEGEENAEWILMDYGSFILHIFSKKTREFYDIEQLWADGPRVTF
jgi:ribosome-associated protein